MLLFVTWSSLSILILSASGGGLEYQCFAVRLIMIKTLKPIKGRIEGLVNHFDFIYFSTRSFISILGRSFFTPGLFWFSLCWYSRISFLQISCQPLQTYVYTINDTIIVQLMHDLCILCVVHEQVLFPVVQHSMILTFVQYDLQFCVIWSVVCVVQCVVLHSTPCTLSTKLCNVITKHSFLTPTVYIHSCKLRHLQCKRHGQVMQNDTWK